MKGIRPERVGEAMREELARRVPEILGKDPRLERAGLVTVTAVKVAGDLGVARVYVSFVGGDPAIATRAVGMLERHASTLRGEIGRALKMRRAPELRFVEDHTAEHAEKIDRLIRGED
jgi:ribosome-binding factor A